MDALNPLTGKIYLLQALEWTRVCRIVCMLMFGKFPLRAGRRPSHEHHPERHLGQLRVPRRPYASCDQWGNKRWSTRSVVIEGKLVSTKSTEINMGMEEFIEHSFYDDWTKTGTPSAASAPTSRLWWTRPSSSRSPMTK